MKRTDLIALAERLEPMAAAPVFDGIDVAALADFLRQIAQAQPVGYLLKTGHGNRFAETIPENPIELTLAGKPAWSAIYTLPLED